MAIQISWVANGARYHLHDRADMPWDAETLTIADPSTGTVWVPLNEDDVLEVLGELKIAARSDARVQESYNIMHKAYRHIERALPAHANGAV